MPYLSPSLSGTFCDSLNLFLINTSKRTLAFSLSLWFWGHSTWIIAVGALTSHFWIISPSILSTPAGSCLKTHQWPWPTDFDLGAKCQNLRGVIYIHTPWRSEYVYIKQCHWVYMHIYVHTHISKMSFLAKQNPPLDCGWNEKREKCLA